MAAPKVDAAKLTKVAQALQADAKKKAATSAFKDARKRADGVKKGLAELKSALRKEPTFDAL